MIININVIVAVTSRENKVEKSQQDKFRAYGSLILPKFKILFPDPNLKIFKNFVFKKVDEIPLWSN
jgi:hypothetical protein